MNPSDLLASLTRSVDSLVPSAIELRRDVHAHPELSWQESRTTSLVAQSLAAAGLRVRPLPGTGLVADLGAEHPAYRIALRADLDALPIRERSGLDYASTTDGVSHACGHDLHVAMLVCAGLALRHHEAALRAGGQAVRLIFQPAEESMPGGALRVIEQGCLDGVDAIYAAHIDPALEVGQVGLREGALTAAADSVTVSLSGRGGHTSRPHLTEDLIFALAKVISEVPAALSRRLDPRAGAVLVWGRVEAGRANNVIPSSGECGGTLRMLDAEAWESVGPLLQEVVDSVVSPYAVTAKLDHVRGVPPVVNSAAGVRVLRDAAPTAGLQPVPAEQSLGGEDFSWYLKRVDGAMARLGTRAPGGPVYDLHQGDLIVDESALAMGAKLLVGAVVRGAPVAAGVPGVALQPAASPA
jgi:amidohydrolase